MQIKKGLMVIFLGLLFVGCSGGEISSVKKDDDGKKLCHSTREFVTTLRFLRAHAEFAVPDDQAVKLADEVSQGCSGAARRFIKVTSLLSQAKLGGNDAISNGKRFASADDKIVETFIAVFKTVYLRNYLDLDVYTSLKTALSLSIDFKGDAIMAGVDFDRLVEFCSDPDELDLPNSQCASMAMETALLGQTYKDIFVSSHFIDLFRFMTDSDGPNLPTDRAIKIARKVVAFGPMAVSNFKHAYYFGKSEGGLGLDEVKALEFAEKMASRSVKDIQKELKVKG